MNNLIITLFLALFQSLVFWLFVKVVFNKKRAIGERLLAALGGGTAAFLVVWAQVKTNTTWLCASAIIIALFNYMYFPYFVRKIKDRSEENKAIRKWTIITSIIAIPIDIAIIALFVKECLTQ